MAANSLATSPAPRWFALLLLLLGASCFVVVWIALGVYLERQLGWMALLGALDAVLMLRLGGMRPGTARMAWAVLATLAISALANWGIIASQLGIVLGLLPWESAVRLGFDHARVLAGLANTGRDLLALCAAPLMAAWLAR